MKDLQTVLGLGAIRHALKMHMHTKIMYELSDGFERDLFAAVHKNLEEKSNPLRLNNFSYAMRELTRHVLYRLSPDDNVVQCSWYKNETNKANGITRKQRAFYAVQGGLDDSYVENILRLNVKDIHNNLIKAINNLSKFTHIEPDSFDQSEDAVNELVLKTSDAFFCFLSTIKECRNLVIDQLYENIDSAVIDEILSTTIQSIDEFTSHYYIDEVYTDNVKIIAIDHESVIFRATGTVYCELQWGSNSDIRRGDGAILPEKFSFACELISPVDQPNEVETVEDSLVVDTRSWQEARYGIDEKA